MIKGSFHEQEEAFAVFSSVFRHSETCTSKAKKTVRRNNAPYLTKQLN